MSSMKQNCENCKLRAHYEKNPKSVLGRFWRWHINFCPGWKAYFTRGTYFKLLKVVQSCL